MWELSIELITLWFYRIIVTFVSKSRLGESWRQHLRGNRVVLRSRLELSIVFGSNCDIKDTNGSRSFLLQTIPRSSFVISRLPCRWFSSFYKHYDNNWSRCTQVFSNILVNLFPIFRFIRPIYSLCVLALGLTTPYIVSGFLVSINYFPFVLSTLRSQSYDFYC